MSRHTADTPETSGTHTSGLQPKPLLGGSEEPGPWARALPQWNYILTYIYKQKQHKVAQQNAQ